MIKTIFTEIRKINVFGRDYQFEKDNSNRSNSISSFILTIFLIVATIVVGFIFGQEIYERKNPKVTTSQTTLDTEGSTISFFDLPVIINFSSSSAIPIDESILDQILQVDVFQFDIKIDLLNPRYSKLSKCNFTKYTNSSKKKYINELSKLGGTRYCLDTNIEVMNKRIDPFSKNLAIIVQKCSKNCIPNLDSYLEGIYVGVIYINDYITPTDYKNPIQYNIKTENLKLSGRISREMTFSFTKNILKTNKGWIFEDYIEENYISFSAVSSEVFYSPTSILHLFIDSPTFVTLSTREYMKIQDLLASIGGFYNAIFIICNFMFSHYIKFCYYEYIYDKLEIQSKISKEGIKKDLLKIGSYSSSIMRNNFVNQNQNVNVNNNNINNNNINSNNINNNNINNNNINNNNDNNDNIVNKNINSHNNNNINNLDHNNNNSNNNNAVSKLKQHNNFKKEEKSHFSPNNQSNSIKKN